MTLPIPNLDDRTYEDLVQEALARIPVECPEWTDHNPSDTGIVLIELLAWLTEMTLYRVNQIPDRNFASFLSLLKGEPWTLPADLTADQRETRLKAEIRSTLQDLERRYRAITPQDFVGLILEDWNHLGDTAKINRVTILPQRNLEADPATRTTLVPAHISVVIVPEKTELGRDPNQFQPLKDALKTFLDQRRLLTTHLHVVPYEPRPVNLSATLVLADGTKPETMINQAVKALRHFFQTTSDPKNPYWGGQGWPFGHGVYESELYQLLDGLTGVDYVTLYEKNETLLVDQGKQVREIPLADYQLVNFSITESDFKLDPVKNQLTFTTGIVTEHDRA